MASSEQTVYNATIDDTSTQITYDPALTAPGANPADGWVQSFSMTGTNAFPGEEGLGQSSHVTSKDGATIVIPFTGEFVDD